MNQNIKEMTLLDFFADVSKNLKSRLISQELYQQILNTPKLDNYLDKAVKSDIESLKGRVEAWESVTSFDSLFGLIQHTIQGY